MGQPYKRKMRSVTDASVVSWSLLGPPHVSSFKPNTNTKELEYVFPPLQMKKFKCRIQTLSKVTQKVVAVELNIFKSTIFHWT